MPYRRLPRSSFVRVLRPLPFGTVPFGTVPFVALLLVALLASGPAMAERFGGTLLDGSRVTYDASAGWETWQGVAPARIERLTFDDADLRTMTLVIAVAADAFDSGNYFRDTNARRTVFETSSHPDIVFEVERVRAAPSSGEPLGAIALPDGAERSLTLTGTLRLHGVERSIDVPVTVRREGDRLAVTGGFEVSLERYEMSAPSIFGRSVEDAVRIRFDLAVALGGV